MRMTRFSPSWLHWIVAAPWLGQALAGYLSVSMTAATQCASSVVTWSGDSGPWHLLLTPTDFNQHGYNVWIPEIPANITNYTLPINQPSGSSFLITMWGASGISYAGTTDIMTVGASPTNNTSCFLTNQQILSLYSFSFNITDTSDGYPPQCSNLTLEWPTSLESIVTSSRRRSPSYDLSLPSDHQRNLNSRALDLAPEIKARGEEGLKNRDESSGANGGNTTVPPTIFGIIPLGNSFSIPITYGYDSNIAPYLPNTSLSSDPTTWTSQGVTSLNWTVEMAKGTRFILIAGIGSEKQWASGGSSKLLTVGQGDSTCVGVTTPDDPDPPPSVTGSSTYTSSASPSPSTDILPVLPNHSVTRIAVASVISIVATLVLVGAIFYCRRRIRQRRTQAYINQSYSPDKSTRLGANSPLDTQLDLLPSRRGSQAHNPALRRLDTLGLEPISPTGSTSNPFLDSPNRVHGDTDSERERGFQLANRTYTTDDSWSNPVSPIRETGPLSGINTDLALRSTSRDNLLRSEATSPLTQSLSTNRSGGTMPGWGGSRLGALQIHNPSDLQSRGTSGENGEDGEEYGSDIADLKRDTLAALDGGQGEGSGNRTSVSRRGGAPDGRRRFSRPTETEYVVHRDAGRVRPPSSQPSERRILELPPRYEELNWDDAPPADGERDNENTG